MSFVNSLMIDSNVNLLKVPDPVRALLEFKPNYFDLVILDYLMPSVNGIEFYKKIRDIDKAVKVMILTASHEQIENKENGLNFKVVRKPVRVSTLMREIDTLLSSDMEVPI